MERGRPLSLVVFRLTDDDHGREAITIVDTVTGQLALIEQPWGFIQKWSPDGRYVVLARRGYHLLPVRLATVAFGTAGVGDPARLAVHEVDRRPRPGTSVFQCSGRAVGD